MFSIVFKIDFYQYSEYPMCVCGGEEGVVAPTGNLLLLKVAFSFWALKNVDEYKDLMDTECLRWIWSMNCRKIKLT